METRHWQEVWTNYSGTMWRDANTGATKFEPRPRPWCEIVTNQESADDGSPES